jgi:hypothetical protein
MKNEKHKNNKFGFGIFSIFFFLSSIFYLLSSSVSPAEASLWERPEKVLVRIFHNPTCKACVKLIEDVLPPIIEKYGDKVAWEYIDTSSEANYRSFLSLGKQFHRRLGSPTVLIGNRVSVGVAESTDNLDKWIREELLKKEQQVLGLEGGGMDLLEHFKSFGPWAVIGAGLVDGFNPCAFTVIVFFISFLTLMGYRRREMALIGAFYILAVFATYLALGFGLFKMLYTLKGFFFVSKIIYMAIGTLSLFLGGLAIKDYIVYKKTGNTDAMALQLPLVLKNKIHAIVGEYYRKDKTGRKRALFFLALSAWVVGFMISLLEAVCTGQLYLPTIVFVLKQGSLRGRALFYLIMYNVMFILPLVLVLLAALGGTTSKQFEAYARRHLGIVKLTMAAVFGTLGVVLWMGI